MESQTFTNIEEYLTTGFNIRVYEELNDAEYLVSYQHFNHLKFFNKLYDEFQFYKENSGNYLEIKHHFREVINLSDINNQNDYHIEIKGYFLLKLMALIQDYLDKNEHTEVDTYSLDFIKDLFFSLSPSPKYLMDPYWVIASEYNFYDVIEHVETIDNVTAKVKYLKDIIIAYKQEDIQTKSYIEDQNFVERCELEIQKYEALINENLPTVLNNKHTQSFRLKLNGSVNRTDFIRIINSLVELNAFERFDNNQPPDKNKVMEAFGNLVGIDLKNYNKDLSKSLNEVSVEKNTEIFKIMATKTETIIDDLLSNSKQKKNK